MGGATELIIKLKPKVVKRENFARASFRSVDCKRNVVAQAFFMRF